LIDDSLRMGGSVKEHHGLECWRFLEASNSY